MYNIVAAAREKETQTERRSRREADATAKDATD